MAIPDKVTKKITLDLESVPRERRTQVKDEIGQLVVESILEDVSLGRSPVKGQGKFKRLSKEYADREKGGDTNPNLDLFGDMLDSLTYKRTRDGIEVGIFASSEVPKADNHNKFSSESKTTPVPKRQFIPKENQTFKRGIESSIKRTISDNQAPQERTQAQQQLESVLQAITTQISIDDLFDGDLI